MSEFDREAIINELRDGALKDPHTGWLSDLARRDLTWDGQDEIIFIGAWYGSVDVGHLAGIVESIISKHTEERTARLEQAEQHLDAALEANKRWAHRSSRERSDLHKTEQAVARVRELNQFLPASIMERITRALDGDGRG